MNKVKKAIIPAAGLGTRFLPATKTVAKEMLPIVDKPSILYIVEEAVAAGIEDIVIIAGRGKTEIEDFFDVSYELEDLLHKQNKTELLDKITHLKDLANIISIRQKRPLGLGHAVLSGQPIVGDQPFAVLLGDEIMVNKGNHPCVTQQLIHGYEKHQMSTVAVMEVPPEEVFKYGIIAFKEKVDSYFKITEVIEKPNVTEAPSCFALPGRYVFDASIFQHLKNIKPGKNNEIQLTDAMTLNAKYEGLLASTFEAFRYDAGDKFGFLQANIELALQHPEIQNKLKPYLIQLADQLRG